MAHPITARDAAAAQRLWQNRELSDGDVDRVLADLVAVTARQDRAADLIHQLAAAWGPLKDTMARAEAFVAACEPKPKKVVERARW